MSRGNGDRYGLSTGMTRGQFLVSLFDNQMNARLSDRALVEVILTEFPKSTVQYSKYIRMYRNKYNRGDFPSQSEAPAIPAPEFDENGKVVDKLRSGPTPRLDLGRGKE